MTIATADLLDGLYHRRGYLRLRQRAIVDELEQIEAQIDHLENPRPVHELIEGWKADIESKKAKPCGRRH